MARKENQMMMNDNIQVTLSKSQFEEQLLQLRSKIESQQFPRHYVVAAFEQLKISAKNLFARRQHNNYQQLQQQTGSGTANTTSVQDVDSHLLKLFQDVSQQVAAIQQQMQFQPPNNTVAISQPSKQIYNNSANFHSFSNNIWEGDKHSFDSGSTVSYFHDETKGETGDEHLFQGFFEDDQNSDSCNQRLNSSGSNSCNNINQILNIEHGNQGSFHMNKYFPQMSQMQQNNLQASQWGDISNEQKYHVQDSIINTDLITPFAKHLENNSLALSNPTEDKRRGSNFQDDSADLYDEDEDEEQTDKLKQLGNAKSFSSNSLKGMITSNNAGQSSITNIKKGKKANLMHNLKNQLKKTNCCNFDTNDDEDEDEEEYEEYQEYYKNVDQPQQIQQGLPDLQTSNKGYQLEIEENQSGQNTIKSNKNQEKSQENLFQTNQFDFRLFDQHHQKISFPLGGGFNDEEEQEEDDQEGDDIEQGNTQDFRQFDFNQSTQCKTSLGLINNNASLTGQSQQQQQKQQLQYLQNCNEEEIVQENEDERDGYDDDYYQYDQQEGNEDEEEYDEGYEEEDETYNANLDVVGQRESFQEGERLSFMASQRIHYYKTEDFNEILNERNPSFEQHCENMRNIIMTMSNNYGGLIMFGLGKNKLVQGISLNSKEKQDFIKFITNIKNSIHNSKQLFCKVSYFPIYRLNSSQQQTIPCNNSQQKDNSSSPFNQQTHIKPQAPTNNTTSHFKLFDQVPPADFSLFSDNPTPQQSNSSYPPLLLFDSDSQTEQDLLFTPFCSSVDPKKKLFTTNTSANTFYNGGATDGIKMGTNIESSLQQNWNCQTSSNWSLETSQSSKRKCSGDTKQWILDRYIIRVFVDQGQKLDATYVYIKNKEITSAIYDKKLKIFKPIYGEPLLNKILSKAQNPSIQAQKLNLAEPDKEGLQASSLFLQPLQQQVQQPISVIPHEKSFNVQSINQYPNCPPQVQVLAKNNQNFGLISSITPPGIAGAMKTPKLAEINQQDEVQSIIGETFKSDEFAKESLGTNSPPLTQEFIKRKRGQKILNDTKKRQIKEKNQKYQQGEEKNQARKSQQHLSSKSNSRESCTTLSEDYKSIPIVKYNLIEFIGFEHSDNAKSFRAQIEKQIGTCLVDCGIAKYDTLFFKVNDQLQGPPTNKEQTDPSAKQMSMQLNCQNTNNTKKGNQFTNLNNNNSFISIGNPNNNSDGAGYFNSNSSNNLSFTDKQYEWMEKLSNYLLMSENWRSLITKERIFKKLIIDGKEYLTDESNQWLCFQNVKNKNNFTSQITQLQQKDVISRVNLYHQHVFIINKQKEFEKFCATNKLFQQCFLSDVIKKGYSNSNILVKSLKNSHRGQESFKQLLNNFKFTITQQGSNFFVCQFQTPLESFLAMERLINHRKQKFILDLFTSNSLDAVIELQDNIFNPQQQQPIQQQSISQQ